MRYRCDYRWTTRAGVVVLVLAASAQAVGDTPSQDAAAIVAGELATDTAERIDELVEQLGHPRYSERRAAAIELRRIGPETFDRLHAATDDADPEIAATARYLLREITVRWVEVEDSPAVRQLLRDYGDLSDEMRSQRIAELAELPLAEAIGALCRAARFDRSPRVSREAALAIIHPRRGPTESTPLDAALVDRQMGPSTRAAAAWLRLYGIQLRDAAATTDAWQRTIDDELRRLERNSDETSGEIVLGLLWNLAEAQRQLDDSAALSQSLERLVALDIDVPGETAIDLMLWLVDYESWDVLDQFIAKHQGRLGHAKLPLYDAAFALADEGKQQLADDLAARAAEIEPQHGMHNFAVGYELSMRGQHDWSVREYRQAIDGQPLAAHEPLIARIFLANLHYDYEEFEPAADALEPLVEAIERNDDVAQIYAEVQRYHAQRESLFLPEPDQVVARFNYYRAGQYRQRQDWAAERQHLERAIRRDETDADVLIAMFRMEGADDEWRQATQQRIRDLCDRFQEQIDQSPDDPTNYNQWAWLVSNTEGDFEQAVRYSHRSLELTEPDSVSARASFLDTLGRCYYAKGDLESAIKYQREAVELLPHLQVMQRQLAHFEQALAKQP